MNDQIKAPNFKLFFLSIHSTVIDHTLSSLFIQDAILLMFPDCKSVNNPAPSIDFKLTPEEVKETASSFY